MHRVATEGHPGLRSRLRRWALVALAALVAALTVVHRFALADLRRLEDDYVAAREPTACATQSLLPFAFDDIDLDELDATIERAIDDALARSLALRDGLGDEITAVPPVTEAHRALAAALDAQVALYVAMRDDPTNSRDELVALGRANARFERRAARLRGLLLVGNPEAWSRRFACDEPPRG